jgi:hypothetical protein
VAANKEGVNEIDTRRWKFYQWKRDLFCLPSVYLTRTSAYFPMSQLELTQIPGEDTPNTVALFFCPLCSSITYNLGRITRPPTRPIRWVSA